MDVFCLFLHTWSLKYKEQVETKKKTTITFWKNGNVFIQYRILHKKIMHK